MRSSFLLLHRAGCVSLVVAALAGCSAAGSTNNGGFGGAGGAAVGIPTDALQGVQFSGSPTALYDAGDCVISIREMHASADGQKPRDQGCGQTLNWASDLDAGPVKVPWTPPAQETYACPSGSVRVHVKDIWSPSASPRLTNTQYQTSAAPIAVMLSPSWTSSFAARQDAANCGWYSTCMPTATATGGFWMKPVDANACSTNSDTSGTFTLSAGQIGTSSDVWLVPTTNSNLSSAYASGGPLGANSLNPVTNKSDPSLASSVCTGNAPDETVPAGYVKLHIRWPWGDATKTGFAGTGCESKDNITTPPYPSSIRVELGTNAAGCDTNLMPGVLEFADGHCPWYSALIPTASWNATQKLTVSTPDRNMFTTSTGITIPAADTTGNEYWFGYTGPSDNNVTLGTPCMDWSTRPNSYAFFTKNPGPGYAHCGGMDVVNIDPCNPPVAAGHSTVHFRYMWAGQKTFTYFPSPDFMPKTMTLSVGGDQVTCTREADRPWFNCAVPNADFKAGATWIASDQPPHLMYPAGSTDSAASAEWNTVQARPFPSTPGEYWIRWTYSKPDMSSGQFTTYTYYPDGTNGDWSATGNWNDNACAPKPPAVPPTVGYGGWFPYNETSYAYPFGASLANTYPDSTDVQSLLNAFVQERYEIWKKNWVRTDPNDTCGPGTYRVYSDNPVGTVSEGQGYGIAISAAMGDKPTFTALWNFARHYLSQSSKKYCGGLMGWMWTSPKDCRPLDTPCDPDTEGCGGNGDSAFDGDVDIGIGLVYAARQWPEFTSAAISWLIKMECEINTKDDGVWYYGTKGDTDGKDCQKYPNQPCFYDKGNDTIVNMSYYAPGYFRVFGDFLQMTLDPKFWPASTRQYHHDFWYKAAETVYEEYERCYDNTSVNPGLVEDFGTAKSPCSTHTDNYNWSRALWRASVDAAWFGNRKDLPENLPGSSQHFPTKSRMQAKIDNIQDYYSTFYVKNPTVPHANQFSTICKSVTPAGNAQGCDPAYDHNSYFVNTAMSSYVAAFDDTGKTVPAIRRQALEESVSTTVQNDHYYQETLGVYTMLFLSGNFPNPLQVP